MKTICYYFFPQTGICPLCKRILMARPDDIRPDGPVEEVRHVIFDGRWQMQGLIPIIQNIAKPC